MSGIATPTAGPPSSHQVLERTAAHLQAAYEHAHAATSTDLLSPWANTAMNIHLAAAALSVHMSGPVLATVQPDCLTALTMASTEISQLGPDHQVPADDLALIRTRLATALDQAHSLTDRPSHPKP